MQTLKALFRLIISFVLLILATASILLLRIILIGYAVVRLLIFNRGSLRKRFYSLGSYLYALAYSYDQTANVMGAPFFNDTMTTTADRFGNPDEPISYAIAKDHQEKTFTKFGLFWANFLIWVDYGARKRGSNHLDESIKNTEQ